MAAFYIKLMWACLAHNSINNFLKKYTMKVGAATSFMRGVNFNHCFIFDSYFLIPPLTKLED